MTGASVDVSQHEIHPVGLRGRLLRLRVTPDLRQAAADLAGEPVGERRNAVRQRCRGDGEIRQQAGAAHHAANGSATLERLSGGVEQQRRGVRRVERGLDVAGIGTGHLTQFEAVDRRRVVEVPSGAWRRPRPDSGAGPIQRPSARAALAPPWRQR